MWLFTTLGFFSVVCLNNRPMDGSPLKGKLTVDKGRVAVRARVRKHLENLVAEFGQLGNPEILDTPGRDYACRIVVPIGVWALVVQSLALRIDYHNFKDAAGKGDVDYVHWLSAVWSRGYAVQKAAPRHAALAAHMQTVEELATMNTRDFIAMVRRTVREGGWRGVDTVVWRALVQRNWASLTGRGVHAKFDLTEEGQRRLGVLL